MGIWLRVAEYAKRKKINRQRVYIEIEKGTIKHRKIKITKELIEVYLD